MSRAGLSLILLAAPLRAEDSKAPFWIDAAARPAYQAAEKIADGVYGFVRQNLIASLLPSRLRSRIDAAPDGDSYAIFAEELGARQARAARRGWETRPAQGVLTPAQIDGWMSDSLAAHRNAALDAFAAALASRYRMRRLSRDSGDLLRDPHNWSPDVLASAAVLGGAYAYFAGVRADFDAGPLKVGLDLAPGHNLRTAARGAQARRLARLALSRRGSPLSFYGEWGPAPAADRVGASWSARF